MSQGMTMYDFKSFSDLLTMANMKQLEAMKYQLQKEIDRRLIENGARILKVYGDYQVM